MIFQTGVALLDAVLNHPIQSLIIIFMAGFVYKFFIRGEERHTAKIFLRDIRRGFKDFYYKLFFHSDSFAGLRTEKLDDVLKLISGCPDVSTWGIARFIEAKLSINETERARLFYALKNLGKIETVEVNGQWHWRIKKHECELN